jgi:uncharacterized protein (DUF305 family)
MKKKKAIKTMRIKLDKKKLSEIKCLVKKIKKEEEQNPSKSIKSNTNNNQNPKNVDQN